MQNFKNDLLNIDIEKSIFATIVYYDYFNYPLIAGEVYQYLIKENPKFQSNPKSQINIICHSERSESGVEGSRRLRESVFIPRDSSASPQNDNDGQNLRLAFSEIIEILDNSQKLKKFIGQKNGFYFLRGREGIIKQRIQKKKLTDQKFKKVKWILRFISYLPFVRLIMLSGSMGFGNPLKESDIDLLIVAKYGRIWTTRAILTFFTLLFGVYRHTGRTENRLCLNHYITDKSLRVNFGNLYKAEEYLNLIPLAGDLNIYEKFFKENNWIKNYVCFDSGILKNNLRAMSLKSAPLGIKKFLEFLLSGFIGDFFEKNIKKFQIYFIKKNPLTKSPRARIRYDDNNLVFHPVLVEPEVIGKWTEKTAEFIA